MKKSPAVFVTVALAITAIAIAPQAANAKTAPPPQTILSTSVPMNAAGFDVAVAAAHGFEIQTDAAGVQTSVPITASAKALVSANKIAPTSSSIAGLASPNVNGNCGSSTFVLQVLGSQLLGATTGYRVRLPILSRTWSWTALSVHGILTKEWPGGAGGTSSKQKTIWTINPYGWWGQVDIGSSVLLNDGTICVSALPASGT